MIFFYNELFWGRLTPTSHLENRLGFYLDQLTMGQYINPPQPKKGQSLLLAKTRQLQRAIDERRETSNTELHRTFVCALTAHRQTRLQQSEVA
ncbi:hypothetical protein [Vacuolonema iberomarrocanum]|uniref:hypothetical protein n=1 Tax=Vacuolonema iberomarrocanum TaxID=3454632 RepID=UPI0019E56A56|nr:hypothetical protein [filamentous cyanobacterium LEGE 07170]